MINFYQAKMKTLTSAILVLVIYFELTIQLHAQHYPAGSEGIKAGSLPQPGFTFEDYNSFYYSDHMQGFGGALNWQNGYSTFSYVQSPRLLWLSEWKVLGANFGMAVRVPIEYKENTFKGTVFPSPNVVSFTVEQSGLADIEVQPVLLSWHLKHFDFSTGYSFWAPTGDYKKNRFYFDNLGTGYWTHSFMFGVTWYPDTEKTWAVSLLNHYDINTEQYHTVVADPSAPYGLGSVSTTLGNIYTLEWAVSKTVWKNVDVGLTGYYQQQVTDTQGPTPNGPTWKDERIHVAGIGPEIKASYVKLGLSGSLRYAYEFSAMDHPQGNLLTLTITKTF